MPAGPTALDSVANAALLFGLTLGLVQEYGDVAEKMPFHACKANFYNAAGTGLRSALNWLVETGPSGWYRRTLGSERQRFNCGASPGWASRRLTRSSEVCLLGCMSDRDSSPCRQHRQQEHVSVPV